MIRHIVMYWLKDSQNEALIQETVQKFHAMEGKIPGLLRVEAGPDVVDSPRSCDLCLCTLFENLDALDKYRDHPLHLPVRDHMHAIMERSVSADFQVDSL